MKKIRRVLVVVLLLAGIAGCDTVRDSITPGLDTTASRESNAPRETQTRRSLATRRDRTLVCPTSTDVLNVTGTHDEPELPLASPSVKLTPPRWVPTPASPLGAGPYSTPPSEETVQPNVTRAIADLAARLNVPGESVEVIRSVPDEFPASDLGCGEYTEKPERPIPALVTGQRILLEVDGRRYVYHAHGVQVVYCGTAEG